MVGLDGAAATEQTTVFRELASGCLPGTTIGRTWRVKCRLSQSAQRADVLALHYLATQCIFAPHTGNRFQFRSQHLLGHHGGPRHPA